jgi:hypothetical protein
MINYEMQVSPSPSYKQRYWLCTLKRGLENVDGGGWQLHRDNK